MDCGTPGLAADLAGLLIRDGHIHCPGGPGLGLTPLPAQLAALASAEPILIS